MHYLRSAHAQRELSSCLYTYFCNLFFGHPNLTKGVKCQKRKKRIYLIFGNPNLTKDVKFQKCKSEF